MGWGGCGVEGGGGGGDGELGQADGGRGVDRLIKINEPACRPCASVCA